MPKNDEANTYLNDITLKTNGIIEVLLGQSKRLGKIEEVFRTIRIALWVTNVLVFVLVLVEWFA